MDTEYSSHGSCTDQVQSSTACAESAVSYSLEYSEVYVSLDEAAEVFSWHDSA